MADEDLEPLITECPYCETRFRVTEAQLASAGGRVRCGACLQVFLGSEHLLMESTPETAESPESPDELLDEILGELGDDKKGDAGDSTDAVDTVREAGDDNREDDPPDWLETEFDTDASGVSEASEVSDVLSASEAWAAPDAPEAAEPDQHGWSADADLTHEPVTELPDHLEDPSPESEDDWEHDAADDAEPQHAFSASAGGSLQLAEAPLDETDDQYLALDDAWTAETSVETPGLTGEAEPIVPIRGVELDASVAAAVSAADPGLLEEPRARGRWVKPLLALGVVALIGQVVWYQKDSWARDPALRPLVATVCDVLGCALPSYKAPGEIQARELVVRAHPSVVDALMVDALLVNGAQIAQPYPVVDLVFTDVNGRVVARRGFKPAEYLDGELTGATEFEPDTPIHISLEIEDPGDDALNYRMTFR